MIAFCFLLGGFSASAQATRFWTNVAGGNWHVAANWSPNGVPASIDSAYITNNGTYTVYATNATSVQSGVIGGFTGTQKLVIDNGITFTCALWHAQTNGMLVISNGTYSGHIVLHTNGQMFLDGPATKTFTSLVFWNWGGAVYWRGGTLFMNGVIAQIENDGLWQMQSDDWLQPSTPLSTWTNKSQGIIRKNAGTGESRIYGFNFVNNPGGLVDMQTGTLTFLLGPTNILGGAFNTAAGATMTFSSGTYYDAGGVFSGAGLSQFYGATLNLRTNNLPGLQLIANQVVLGTNFQQAGAITNLTLDGATLSGTNRVGNGTLTVNSGSFGNRLTVQPAGQLLLASSTPKNFTSSILINQGTVDWTGGAVAMGAGAVSNGGLWKIECDEQFYSGGALAVLFTNGGTFQKTAGAGGAEMTRVDGVNFINLNGGLVQVDAGILRMPQNYTNTAGTLRLNGGMFGGSSGAFFGFGPMYLAGGTLDGSGSLDQFSAVGGTVSPGNSPGLIRFSSGLNLSAGAVLSIEGTGTTPGTGYDQLSVTGAVAVSNCTLQVSSLPAVPFGTAFTIIDNDGSDAVLGTFNGLPENSAFTANGKSYRIHYAGGSGNDVVLVNESGAPPAAPTLTNGGYSNGSYHLLGAGASTLVYTIQASTNLVQWTNIGTTTGDLGGGLNFFDTNASKFSARFYRTTN